MMGVLVRLPWSVGVPWVMGVLPRVPWRVGVPWRSMGQYGGPQGPPNPCDDASCSTRLFFKAIVVTQSGIFLFCPIICFYLVAGAIKMSVVSSYLLFGFSEKAIAFFCFY